MQYRCPASRWICQNAQKAHSHAPSPCNKQGLCGAQLVACVQRIASLVTSLYRAASVTSHSRARSFLRGLRLLHHRLHVYARSALLLQRNNYLRLSWVLRTSPPAPKVCLLRGLSQLHPANNSVWVRLLVLLRYPRRHRRLWLTDCVLQ